MKFDPKPLNQGILLQPQKLRILGKRTGVFNLPGEFEGFVGMKRLMHVKSTLTTEIALS